MLGGRIKELFRSTREPGQVLVLFALASIPMLAFVGLAIDGGYAFAQRRLAQNAADAAVLAGLSELANSNSAAIGGRVSTYVSQNAGGTAVPTWTLIDNGGASLGQSSSSATGVQVTVSKTYNTFFLQVVGRSTFTVSATATGKVQALGGFLGDPPFLVCNSALQEPSDTPYPGGILDYSTSPPSLRPDAIGRNYYIHGPHVGHLGGGCNWELSNFKGGAEDGQVGCASVPCWMEYQNGTKAGPTRNRVAGYTGCADSEPSSACVMILPIVEVNDYSPACAGSPPSSPMCVVAWAAFNVTPCGSNCHDGVLLGAVTVFGSSGVDAGPGYNGPRVLRLAS